MLLAGETRTLVASVRVGWQDPDRIGICRRGAPGFDLGTGRRRWRALARGFQQVAEQLDPALRPLLAEILRFER